MLETDTRPEGKVTRCIWQQHSVPSHEDKVACHSDEYDSMRRAGSGGRAGGLRASEVASLFQMASSYSPNPTLSPSAPSVCSLQFDHLY